MRGNNCLKEQKILKLDSNIMQTGESMLYESLRSSLFFQLNKSKYSTAVNPTTFFVDVHVQQINSLM